MIPEDIVAALRDVAGDDAVTTDPVAVNAHAVDAWPVSVITEQIGRTVTRPDVVVTPADEAAVAAVLKTANNTGIPVTPWGLGSSVTGQPLPLHGGISLDLRRLVDGPDFDETNRIVTVGAGTRGGALEAWLNERGYTLNHFPQSLLRSSVGGWIATRATGQFSSRYGGIENLLVGCRVVLADGSITDLVQRPRAAMGPDLRSVFLGSEGTLGVITRVSVKVFAAAPHRVVEAFDLNDVRAGLEVLRVLYQEGLRPFLVRFYDSEEARHVLDESAGPVGALLLIGSEGVEAVAQAEFTRIREHVATTEARSLGQEPVHRWLATRYDFSGVERLLAEPGGYAETIEVANLWSRLAPMYDELKTALTPYADEVLGHFSHIYDQGASLYVILRGHASDDVDALSRLETIWATAMEIVVRHDGELSHHHGGGLARRPWVKQSLGSGFTVLERIKASLDPRGILNPGKLALGGEDVRAPQQPSPPAQPGRAATTR